MKPKFHRKGKSENSRQLSIVSRKLHDASLCRRFVCPASLVHNPENVAGHEYLRTQVTAPFRKRMMCD